MEDRLILAISLVPLSPRRSEQRLGHPADPKRPLCQQLREALVDEYVRKNKQSRDYPRKKPHTRTGPPNIVPATPKQVQQAKTLKNALAAKKG